jgi:glycosyltransferase involved in cell wall biosynthesis
MRARAGHGIAAPTIPTSLSLFVPMYNERDNIARTLDRAATALSALGLQQFEIIVVDDGSTDGSAYAVQRWIEHHPLGSHARIVAHARNEGYGRALTSGFGAARHDLVFYTDADLPVDLSELRRALPLIADADLVIGYRACRVESVRRKVYSRIYNSLMRLLFRVDVRDVNFSFKLVRRDALQGIRLSARTVFIDGQLLAEARHHQLRITEMPVAYQPRVHGTSHFDSPRVALDTLRELAWHKLTRSLGRARIH